jgi:hypothetical protein
MREQASQSNGNAGEVLKIETVSSLRLVRRLQQDGGGMLFSEVKYFVHHIPDGDPMLAETFRNAIPYRYRLNVSPLS